VNPDWFIWLAFVTYAVVAVGLVGAMVWRYQA
jgi:nitrate reductase NapE component